MATIGNLVANLTLQTAAFNRNLQQAAQNTATQSAAINRAMRGVEQQGRAVERAFGQVKAGALALVGVLAVRQFAQFAQAALDSADALREKSAALGITSRALQEYRVAAGLSGVQTEKFDKAIERFVRNLGDARAGTGTMVAELGKTDQAFLRTLYSAGSTGEALDLMFARIAETGSAFDRASLAAAAFGREGVALTNIVAGGTAGLAAMRGQARDLGLVLSDELLAAADDINDRMALLRGAFEAGFARSVIGELADQFQLTRDNIEAAREAGENFGRLVGVVMRGLAGALELVGGNLRAIVSALAALIAYKAAAMFLGLAVAVVKFAEALVAAAKAGALLNTLMSKSMLGLLARLVIALGLGAAVWSEFNAEADKSIKGMEKLTAEIGSGAAPALDAHARQIQESTIALGLQAVQYDQLARALARGSVEYAALTDEIELENEATRLNIDLATAAGRKWADAAREASRAKKDFEAMKEADAFFAKTLEDQAKATAEAAREAAKVYTEVWRNALEDVQRSLTDRIEQALAGNLTTLGDWASAFLSIVRRLAANLLAQQFVVPLINAGASVLGIPGLPGGMGGGLDLLGMGAKGFGLADSFGAFGAGAAGASAALPLAAASHEAIAAGFAASQPAMVGGFTATGGLGASLAAAAPYAAAAVIAIQIGMSMFKKKSVGPNANAIIENLDGLLKVTAAAADNGGDMAAALAAGTKLADDINATLATLGGRIKDEVLLQVGSFPSKGGLFVNVGGTPGTPQNVFGEDAAAAGAFATMAAIKNASFASPMIAAAAAAAATLDEFNKSVGLIGRFFAHELPQPVGAMQQALTAFAESAAALRAAVDALGITAGQAEAAIAEARNRLTEEFTAGLERDIRAASGLGVADQLSVLAASAGQQADAAAALGNVDIRLLRRWTDAQAGQAIGGLDAATLRATAFELAKLGDNTDTWRDRIIALIVTQLNAVEAADQQASAGARQAEAANQAADAYRAAAAAAEEMRKAARALLETATSILRDIAISPLGARQAFDLQVEQFRAMASRGQISDFPEIQSLAVQIARDAAVFFASGPQAAAVRAEVVATLQNLGASGLARADAYQAEALRALHAPRVGMAGGGTVIGGIRGVDSVPIYLASGERVLSAADNSDLAAELRGMRAALGALLALSAESGERSLKLLKRNADAIGRAADAMERSVA